MLLREDVVIHESQVNERKEGNFVWKLSWFYVCVFLTRFLAICGKRKTVRISNLGSVVSVVLKTRKLFASEELQYSRPVYTIQAYNMSDS